MGDDPELAAIRAQRLAEMQSGGGGGGGGEAEQMKNREESMKREAEMKNSLLTQILDQSARARLNSIALVKPDRAKSIENMLIQMARSGQLQGKLSETLLISLLERVNKQMEKSSKVTIDRRRYAMDSDDDDY